MLVAHLISYAKFPLHRLLLGHALESLEVNREVHLFFDR